MIYKNEQQFLAKNRRFLEPMLKRRIEEYKELILNVDDDEKRNKYILWVKEFKYWVGLMKQADNDKDDNFTGI